jgi:hypothetical protein
MSKEDSFTSKLSDRRPSPISTEEVKRSPENEHLFTQLELEDKNWYEIRVNGTPPERRAYHSSFIHNQT